MLEFLHLLLEATIAHFEVFLQSRLSLAVIFIQVAFL